MGQPPTSGHAEPAAVGYLRLVFLGAALAIPAALLAAVFLAFVHDCELSPMLGVAVGAAAGMAAGSRMLITPVLFAGLHVGKVGLDATPDAVLAASAAWLSVQALDRRSQAAGG